MTTVTYKISGMDCQGCVKSLTRCIKGLSPDATVEVELQSGRVSVSNATATQVAEAAKMAGFGFEGEAA
jgi:copper chaperone